MTVPRYYRHAMTATAELTDGLRGPVRVMPGGYLGDARGYCKILGCHIFPLLRLLADDPAFAQRCVATAQRAGFRSVRLAHLMANDFDQPTPPGSYWSGRDISKPVCRATIVRALDLLRTHGLRAVLTAGHEYQGSASGNSRDEYGWWDELTGLIADAGHAETVLAVEALGNEVGANRPWLTADVHKAMTWSAGIQAIVRRNLPGVLVTNGDFGEMSTVTVDPLPNLISSSAGADLMDIHSERSMPGSVRYVHTEWNDTHFHATCLKPIHQGEEPGENAPYPENTATEHNPGGDVYVGCDDQHYLHTRHALDLLTGQLTSYLNGPGVRCFVDLDSTKYFNKLVSSMEPIPEDIVTWRDEHNPSWWIRGKEFIYVGLAAWGQLAMPPHAVAHANVYDIDGKCGEARGTRLEPPKGWKGGIVRGVFE